MEDWILKLNLCPFAHAVYRDNQVRFEVENSTDFKRCVKKAIAEIEYLQQNSDRNNKNYIDTTFLIFPKQEDFNTSFMDFLDFAALINVFIEQKNLSGVFQLVAFHPNYIFQDEDPNSKSHYTNRSPYPTLHILREESVEKAGNSVSFANVFSIPEKNIAKLEKMDDKEFEWLNSFKR